MWNNSYRTPTERWQKTSDFPKGKKIPMYLGKAKGKKKKQRQKNRHGTCTSGRELWRRKSFHTLESPFTGGNGGWAGGKLRSHGGERSNWGAEGKAERFLHRGSVLTSTHQPERVSAHPPGQEGAGSWGSGFGGQIPGRGLGLAAWTQPEESYCTTASWEGVPEKVWTCLWGKRPLFQSERGEGIQSTTSTSYRDRRKPWLSAWTPETGMKN